MSHYEGRQPQNYTAALVLIKNSTACPGSHSLDHAPIEPPQRDCAFAYSFSNEILVFLTVSGDNLYQHASASHEHYVPRIRMGPLRLHGTAFDVAFEVPILVGADVARMPAKHIGIVRNSQDAIASVRSHQVRPSHSGLGLVASSKKSPILMPPSLMIAGFEPLCHRRTKKSFEHGGWHRYIFRQLASR